jgi:hypothetical protein
MGPANVQRLSECPAAAVNDWKASQCSIVCCVLALDFVLLVHFPNDIKASKLKPDAPEFVPFRIKAPADLTPPADSKDPESPSKINPKDTAKAQKKQGKEERKAANLAKKLGRKAGKQVDGSEGTFECI